MSNDTMMLPSVTLMLLILTPGNAVSNTCMKRSLKPVSFPPMMSSKSLSYMTISLVSGSSVTVKGSDVTIAGRWSRGALGVV